MSRRRIPHNQKTRTYQAATMAEALAAVKCELGRDAVILHTRRFRKGGLLGLIGGRPMWEVTASANTAGRRRAIRGAYVSDAESDPGHDLERLAGAGADLGTSDETREPGFGGKQPLSFADPPAPEFAPAPSAAVCTDVGKEVSELRRLVEALVSRSGGRGDRAGQPADTSALRDVQTMLHRQDVEDEIVADLARQLRAGLTDQQLADPQSLRCGLADLVASRIRTVGEDGQATRGGRVIALIGPTGVGKTTTIAKLAANFKIRQGRRVGLITIDTYRIAAVDQLKTYADIIDVPLRAVLTPEELREAIAGMKGMDAILIDTAGRSQNDKLRLGQLRKFLEVSKADEIHLVISATANRACTRSILGRFLPLGANRVILTKLDEADCYGSVLNVAAWSSAAMSYVTVGQEVPDDIIAADARRMAQWIVGGRHAD